MTRILNLKAEQHSVFVSIPIHKQYKSPNLLLSRLASAFKYMYVLPWSLLLLSSGAVLSYVQNMTKQHIIYREYNQKLRNLKKSPQISQTHKNGRFESIIGTF